MMNILITSAGQRVSLVRAFKREILRIDKQAKVYTVDLNPFLAPGCHVSDGYRAVPPVTSDGYIKTLLAICQQWNVKMIVPTIDTELKVLSKNKHLFVQCGVTPIVSEKTFIDICRDKRILNDFFTDRGIDIPKEIERDALRFPIFIKPYDGSLSKDIYLINNKSELTDYHLNNPKLMFMEYINPLEYDEYTVDCYYNNDNVLCCAVPRKRILVRAGEVNKGVTRKNEILPFLKEKLSKIEGAIGCLTMQFFLHVVTGRIIGIEINPRFGGGFPLSYLAGANYPRYLIDEYILGTAVRYFEDWEDSLLMLRYDDEILVHEYDG